jgi:chromosome segregation ATPase
MSAETLALIGGVLATLVGVIAMAARSLRTTSQAIGELSQTNMALNKEMKETAAERREREKVHETERGEWKAARVELQCQVDALQSKLIAVETDNTQYQERSQRVIDQLGQELVKVKQELAEARQEAQAMKDSIDKLTSALAAAQDRVKELEARENQLRLDLADCQKQIAILERDNLMKDTEIAKLTGRVSELEIELARVQVDRQRLEDEKAALLRQLNESVSGGDEGNPAEPEPSEDVTEKGE